MATIQGNDRILYLKQAGEFTPIACLTTNSIAENTDVFETTTRASGGWKSYLPDNQGYTLSFSGINQLSGISVETLQILKRNRLRLTWGIGSEGNIIEEGFGYLIDLSVEDEVNQSSIFSGTIQGDGVPLQNLSALGANLDDFLNDGNGNLLDE